MSKTFFYKDNWVDAQEMHRNNPNTFYAPSEEEINNIEKGFTVKISNGQERFWNEVVEINNNHLLVKIDNQLVGNKGYNYGDILWIEKKNIFDIHTKEMIEKMKEEFKVFFQIINSQNYKYQKN